MNYRCAWIIMESHNSITGLHKSDGIHEDPRYIMKLHNHKLWTIQLPFAYKSISHIFNLFFTKIWASIHRVGVLLHVTQFFGGYTHWRLMTEVERQSFGLSWLHTISIELLHKRIFVTQDPYTTGDIRKIESSEHSNFRKRGTLNSRTFVI